MSYDVEQIKQMYDELSNKVKNDLNEQFNLGRLKGSDYANVYAQLMNTILQLSFETPLKEANKNKIDYETNNILPEQKNLYERQIKGFDDNLKQKLLEIQFNGWSMPFTNGMLDDIPKIVKNDELTALYNSLQTELGLIQSPILKVIKTPQSVGSDIDIYVENYDDSIEYDAYLKNDSTTISKYNGHYTLTSPSSAVKDTFIIIAKKDNIIKQTATEVEWS